MRRTLLLAVVVAAALLGELGALAVSAQGTGKRHVSLMLDWTPNPDHVGFYYAQAHGLYSDAGLDVSIHAPSDPASPLKLVAAGKVDLAVSYEQELFFAAAKKLPLVAVAAVVPHPLNSIMSIEHDIRTARDLKGKTIGITGVPSDYAALDTALRSAHLTRKDVKVVTVGYNLLPALLAKRVDAVLGVYRNVEGIELQQRGLHPTIIPLDRAGVPSYDELVLAASSSRLRTDPGYASMVRSFVHAFLLGTADARRDPHGSLELLRSVTASSDRFLARATPATLALLSGPHGVGCMSTRDWRRFGVWMHAGKLLSSSIPAAKVMTTRYLPARCTRSG
ncbi:MAG: ABC transporter substrate-binding protein [Gaiellaceae bacterium]